jgi:hypothetical protein
MMIARFIKQRVLVSSLVFALVAGLSGCGGAAGGRDKASAAPAGQEPPRQPVAYDHAITDTARVLAGLLPEDAQRFGAVVGRPGWKAYQAESDTNWSQIEQQRFKLMREWRDKEFKALADGCDTLFYPFAGPDFLNAYLLYPKCKTYLLFGLESVGSVPALESLKGEQVDKAFVQLREALSDIFKRDYFITKTMESELRASQVDGTLPLILVFLARMDAKVVSIDTDGPWNTPAGTAPATAPATTPANGAKPAVAPRSSRLPAVTVSFVGKDSDQIQKVTYIRVDMMNPQYSKHTSLLAYLKGLGPVTTFVKSASYLMQDDRFSIVRDMVLNQSASLLQDDTGVPFRFFDKAKWTLTFYGKYSAPIRDFNYGFQRDLDAVFKQPGVARDLPFSFGYHWREGTSSVMLAVRKQ